jgi:hypothetical protein
MKMGLHVIHVPVDEMNKLNELILRNRCGKCTGIGKKICHDWEAVWDNRLLVF